MYTNLNNLSIFELKKIKKDEQQKLKQEFSQYKKKQKLINDIMKIQQTRNKIKPQPKPKSFDEYFQECIRNRTIPADTPPYLRKAVERALREYQQGIIKEKSALEEFANKYVIKGEPGVIPFEYFQSKAPQLKEFLRNHRNIKVRLVLVCLMEKIDGDGKLSTKTLDKAYFHSDTHINLAATDVKQILAVMIKKIIDGIEFYQKAGSGWYFKEVVNLEIHTVDYRPIMGSSYIPLPDFIMRKKAIINIQNRDNKCFLWSVLRYLHPANRDENRLTDLKQYENDLNTKGINYPVKLKDISKFESLNPSLPGINVFSISENNKFYPLRMAQRNPQETIDLFLYECDGKYHYSLIKNFSRLFRSQITSRTNGLLHICKKCFTHFSKEDLYDKHIEYCSSNETAAVRIPPRNTKLRFVNYQKQLPIPFVVYADFESFTKSMSTCNPNPDKS